MKKNSKIENLLSKNLIKTMNIDIRKNIGILIVFISFGMYAQQDPQFTQYMYNTMSVNSAYAGSRGNLSVTGIHRSQWVGIDGAPRTQTLTVDSPIGKKVGLGLSIVNDQIGPSDEFYVDLNFSYTIQASQTHKLSFGVKGGGRLFSLDWTRGQSQNPDVLFQQNIDNRFLPTVGAGLYLHGEKSYLGISIPNFFTDQHYDDIEQSLASERLHFFLIGGLVFDINANTKFKPAFLLKHVVGAPLIVDLSANFMFYDKFRLGASYRWDDSFSGLAGFQVSPGLLIGYAYDYTTTELQQFTTGSHEIMIRFELISAEKRLKSPRFF